MTVWIPRLRSQARLAADEYALSARGRVKASRISPPPT